MGINTLLKVLEQLLHKIKAKRRREMLLGSRVGVENAFMVLVKHRDKT